MSHSLKRQSLFYIKFIQNKPPPSLKSIYRNYLKSGLNIYKHCNKSIGSYLFKLLQHKRTYLENQHAKIIQINQFLQQLERKMTKCTPTSNSLFRKSSQSLAQHTQSELIRVKNQKAQMERIFTQKLLQIFQSLHHFSTTINDALNSTLQIDLHTAQLSKLIHLSFSVSQFFSPTLLPRKQYQSLLILQHLQDDMEYEVLSEKDKDFVRDVIIKVCGGTKLNHTRYRTVNEYLKDPNAVLSEPKHKRIELMSKSKRHQTEIQKQNDKLNLSLYQSQSQTIGQTQQQKYYVQKQEQQDQGQDHNDQWTILSEQERNKAVRKIFESKKKQFSLQQQENNTRSVVSKKYLSKTVLFQILINLKLNQILFNPKPVIQQQLYQICRRLFKLQSQTISQEHESILANGLQSGQQPNKALYQQTLRLPLLEDVIIQHGFIDQFVNSKKIIIV